MARRVNVRFIVVLGIVVTILSGGGAIAWYLARSTSLEHIELGEQLMEQGAHDLAIEQFGKAVYKDPQDPSLLLLYCDSLSQVPTSDARKARDHLRQMQAGWEKVLQLDPGNSEAFTRLMDLYVRLGRDLRIFSFWTLMFDRCQEVLTRRPDLVEAIKYRGIAQTRRMGPLDVDPPDRLQAEQDLRSALERDADDLDVHFHLAMWHGKEAELTEKSAPAKSANHRRLALEVAEQMSARHPGDGEAQLNHLRILMPLEEYTAAEHLVYRLEQQMLEQPISPRAVLDLINLTTSLAKEGVDVSPDSVWERAETLLRRGLEQWPTETLLYMGLGRTLRRLRKIDEAIQIFDHGREMTGESNSIDVHLQFHLRMACTFEYLDLRLSTIESLETEQRQIIIDETKQELDKIVPLAGEGWHTHKILGKIAMAEGQWEVARAEFDIASTKLSDTDAELLLLSATMRIRLREYGAATTRLKSLIEMVPTFQPPYRELARLHLSLRELEEAEHLIEQILKKDPKDRVGRLLMAELLAQRDQFDQALAIYRRMDPATNPEILLQMARLQQRAGRLDETRQLLQQYLNDHPTSLSPLQKLIHIRSDNETALAYVQKARQAGGNVKVLDLLEAQIHRSGVQEAAETLIKQRGTALEQHLQRYSLLKNLGKADEALAELDAAAKLDPDHPAVISAQFLQALALADWDQAHVLVSQAAQTNLDQGMGNFFYGQLYYAQGQFERAAASFQEGLRLRQIYSTGWRQLGDTQFSMGDLSEATSSYKEAIKQRPNNVEARRGLALVHHRNREFVLALEQMREAIEHAPGNRILRAQYLTYEQDHGNPALALAFCERQTQTNPEDAEIRRLLAILLAQQEQHDQAMQTVGQLIAEQGPNLTVMRTKATILAEAGDVDAGRQLLEDYLTNLKDKATAADWEHLGRFLFIYGQADAARSAYRRAIAVEDPEQQSATRGLADRLFEIGDYEQANKLYTALWESYPDDKRIGMRFVESLTRQEKLEDAQNVLEGLIQKYPSDGGTLLLEGYVAQAKGERDRALDAFNASIAQSPHEPLAYFRRAQILANDPEKHVQAIADLNRALELNADLAPARRLLAQFHLRHGERPEAIRELKTLLRRTPGDQTARRQLAKVYFSEDQRPALLALLEESADLFEDDATWPLYLSNLARREDRQNEMVEHLRHAHRLQPAPQILGALVAALLDTHQPQQVLDLLRDDSQTTSQSPVLQAQRGRALVSLGRTEDATVAFDRAIERVQSPQVLNAATEQMVLAIGPERTIEQLAGQASGQRAAWVEMTMAQLHIRSHNYANALSLLEKVDSRLASDATERLVYNRFLAIVQHETGDLEAAKTTYERLLEANPNDLTTLNNLGFILANDLNDAERGLKFAARAVSLAPNNATILDTLGWAQFKSGRLEEAQGTLKQSVELQPGAANCLHLAQVLLERDDTARASELLESATQLAEQMGNTTLLKQARQLLQTLE